MKRLSIPLRLSALPLAAGLTVLIISAISLIDLERSRGEGEDKETLQVLRRKRTNLVARSKEVRKLTEEDALLELRSRPSRPGIDALWANPVHRERLREVLLSKDSPEEVRLHILTRFWDESPEEAREAARRLAGEATLTQGPLRLAVYEVLAREGEEADLALLSARPKEPPQTRALREEYRDLLRRRSGLPD